MKESLKEFSYILYRRLKAYLLSTLFYVFRIYPVKKEKVVFSNFEGRGYGCNPKYIAEEILKRNRYRVNKIEIVWLVNHLDSSFPEGITKVKNNLLNRAYQLATAGVWIDNVRKPLETRKRKNQLYVATWHGAIGFKPVGKLRGKAFPKIAEIVSRHDSSLVDYFISNSRWCTEMYRKAFFFEGEVLETGTPRCDVLNSPTEKTRCDIREEYGLPININILMYAPTFRGGNQKTSGMNATRQDMEINLINEELLNAMKEKFGGEWVMFIRLHPNVQKAHGELFEVADKNIINVSDRDDAYDLLASVDAFISDYSSMAFDAASGKAPVFIYANDIEEYVNERGELLWNLEELPFSISYNNVDLIRSIKEFDSQSYQDKLHIFFDMVELKEDGLASRRIVDKVEEFLKCEV